MRIQLGFGRLTNMSMAILVNLTWVSLALDKSEFGTKLKALAQVPEELTAKLQ